jgi:hypothetical protein
MIVSTKTLDDYKWVRKYIMSLNGTRITYPGMAIERFSNINLN